MSLIVAMAVVAIGAQSVSIPIGDVDGREFELALSHPVALDDCQLHAFQSGAFGGRGYDLPKRTLGGGRFALRTGVNGVPASRLKVAVWCRGYAIALVDVPSLEAVDWKGAVTLTVLPLVIMSGRVLPPDDGMSLAGSRLVVLHNYGWLCGFFELPDCLTPIGEIAGGVIGRDGSFSVSLPDLARDPVIARWGGARHLGLRVDRAEPPYHYAIESADGTGPLQFADIGKVLLLRARRSSIFK